MKSETFVLTIFVLLGTGLAVEPTVKCPVPVSPLHGQVFLMRNGNIVKYACDNGYKLLGSDMAHCKDEQWLPEPPTCIEEEDDVSITEKPIAEPVQPLTTPRPLFKWDENKETASKTEEEMQNDEARLHMLLYPERRYVRTRVRQAKSEENDKKDEKSDEKETNPSVVYVRRGIPGYRWLHSRAALHDPNVVSVSKEENNGEVAQNDERWRYLHWLAQAGYTGYPGYPYPTMQTVDGHPVVMTLSESQLAWINSLYPDVRDKYLRDLYKMRAGEFSEELRAQHLMGHYGDAYRWYYNNPYYTRQPVSVVDDPVSNFDYSCHQVGDDGRARLIRAPRLPNAHVYRYDRRRNPNYPDNHYLAAEYRCDPGYVLIDSRVNEMYCSRKGWVGTYPVCVPRQ